MLDPGAERQAVMHADFMLNVAVVEAPVATGMSNEPAAPTSPRQAGRTVAAGIELLITNVKVAVVIAVLGGCSTGSLRGSAREVIK